jgi:hypothetical protein
MTERWELLELASEITISTPQEVKFIKIKDFIKSKGGAHTYKNVRGAIPYILAEGWEPFAVASHSQGGGYDILFRRKINI